GLAGLRGEPAEGPAVPDGKLLPRGAAPADAGAVRPVRGRRPGGDAAGARALRGPAWRGCTLFRNACRFRGAKGESNSHEGVLRPRPGWLAPALDRARAAASLGRTPEARLPRVGAVTVLYACHPRPVNGYATT